MDSFTHVLAPALFTEPDTKLPSDDPPAPAWRVRVALILGALIADADGTLGWIDRALYARYHRVFTHSVGGALLVILISATVARYWPAAWTPRRWRHGPHTGWRAWRRYLGVAAIAMGMHEVLDLVTAWQIQPFWPFSTADLSLGRVNSLDPVALAFTVVFWAAQHVALTRGRKRLGWTLAAGWLVTFVLYVWLRPILGPPAYT